MMNRITPTVKLLLIVNLVVFALTGLILKNQYELLHYFKLYNFASPEFNPVQILTHMFTHGGFRHILGNMLVLFFFGPIMEQQWGSERLLKYWLICGIGAGLIFNMVNYVDYNSKASALETFVENPSFNAMIKFADKFPRTDDMGRPVRGYLRELAANYDESPALEGQIIQRATEVLNSSRDVPMVGASGAVFGLLIALFIFHGEMVVQLLFPPIPIKIKWLVLGVGAYTLYSILNHTPGDNVAHVAHLSGAAVGYLLIWMMPQRWNKFI